MEMSGGEEIIAAISMDGFQVILGYIFRPGNFGDIISVIIKKSGADQIDVIQCGGEDAALSPAIKFEDFILTMFAVDENILSGRLVAAYHEDMVLGYAPDIGDPQGCAGRNGIPVLAVVPDAETVITYKIDILRRCSPTSFDGMGVNSHIV